MSRRGPIVRLGDGSVARLGCDVYDVADPRHVGTLIAIEWSSRGVVRWHGTGWKSGGLPLESLHRYKEEQNQ
jgi:hypothetical protein